MRRCTEREKNKQDRNWTKGETKVKRTDPIDKERESPRGPFSF